MLRRLSTITPAPPKPPMPSAAAPVGAPVATAAGMGLTTAPGPTWQELSQRLTRHLHNTLGQHVGGATTPHPDTARAPRAIAPHALDYSPAPAGQEHP